MPINSVIRPLWPLFFGLALLGLAGGAQTTLLGYRAQLEGFGVFAVGALVSSYYGGFLLGSWLAPRFLRSVGHIRTFGAVTALASVTVLVHASIVETGTWIVMRFLTGFAFSSIYVVTESWLNRAADNTNRGGLLALYMVLMLAGTTFGQLLLDAGNPRSHGLFLAISILVSVAAIPILMTRLPAPLIDETDSRVTVGRLWRRAPAGVLGLLLAQGSVAVISGLGPAYAARMGFSAAELAYFMSTTMAGGMVLQWPLGRLSDRIDRRWVLLVSGLAALGLAATAALHLPNPGPLLYGCSFLLGGFTLSQYSIVVALIQDALDADEVVPATGTIVLLCGLVSIAAPILVSSAWVLVGREAFHGAIAVAMGLLALVSLRGIFTSAPVDADQKASTAIQAAINPVGQVLLPDLEPGPAEPAAAGAADSWQDRPAVSAP